MTVAPDGAGPPVSLVDPVTVGSRQAPSRVMFGPHETNLAWGRALSDRHTAYYLRRARGGAGIVVTETASVTGDDWPYERAPLAAECPPGWRRTAEACAAHGTVVLAGIGHSGGQGSSAYSQQVMWAPSRVADVVSREPPAELEPVGIDAIVAAFAHSAGLAMESGLAGVEIDAGAWSLLRQFHSGLTNQRGDAYGSDRLLLTRRVLAEVRRAVGSDGIVALRLSCDELAPWAGVTPDQAEEAVAELAGSVDLLTVVRAGPFATGAYRPDFHTSPAFNLELCRRMRSAAGGRVPVVLQGSVVDPDQADQALADLACDLVEMTRALIADARLVEKARSGRRSSVRPCIRCNQACRVRDNRNPIVSCVMDPASGYETRQQWDAPGRDGRGSALVVGAGPAGLECARILAFGGWRVRVVDRGRKAGGRLALTGRGHLVEAADWLAGAATAAGASVELATEVTASDVRRARAEGVEVVLATGSLFMAARYPDAALPVLDPLDVLSGRAELPAGPVAVLDPVGDSVGVDMAERLAATGRPVTLICPDPVAGTQLARTGDLADANVRLQRAGVTRRLRSLVRAIGPSGVEVEDCWTAEAGQVPATAVVDCGHRLPDEQLYLELGDPRLRRIGDCVAPRGLLEAVLEGRRAALSILASERRQPVPA